MIYSKKCFDEIGYQVIVSLVDGHSSNVKFYKELSRGGGGTPSKMCMQ